MPFERYSVVVERLDDHGRTVDRVVVFETAFLRVDGFEVAGPDQVPNVAPVASRPQTMEEIAKESGSVYALSLPDIDEPTDETTEAVPSPANAAETETEADTGPVLTDFVMPASELQDLRNMGLELVTRSQDEYYPKPQIAPGAVPRPGGNARWRMSASDEMAGDGDKTPLSMG